MNFFAFHENNNNYRNLQISPISDLAKYQSFFIRKPGFENMVFGEKSVSLLYLPWTKHVISNIKKTYIDYRELKLIFILRQPVNRMFSQYLFNLNFDEHLSFTEAIDAWSERKKEQWLPAYDYLGASFYAESIELFQKNFDQVKVLLYSDLLKNEKESIFELSEFLKIDRSFYNKFNPHKFNVGGIPTNRMLKTLYRIYKNKIFYRISRTLTSETSRQKMKSNLFSKPELDIKLFRKLNENFEEDILKLESIIGKDLKHWL